MRVTERFASVLLVLALWMGLSGASDELRYAGNTRDDLRATGVLGKSTAQKLAFASSAKSSRNYEPAPATESDAATRAVGTDVSPDRNYSPYMEVMGQGSNYTLGIDDVVTIVVRGQPEFSGRYVVDPEGNIQYTFVGNIKAEGKTRDELKADLAKALTEYVRHPEVAVMISEYRSKSVYVIGHVNKPGKYAMKGDKITVKEAIVSAGLYKNDADSKIYVVRPSNMTKDGKAARRAIDMKQLIEKGQAQQDFILQPGDMIIVGQRAFDRFCNTYTKVLTPVFETAALVDVSTDIYERTK